jgi:BCD family chlorophyll transporter-like MFS transporter
MNRAAERGLGWLSIARLGLVQVAIGAVVVLMTSTLNRVMVVELGLAASVPGALVALHFFVQLLRPQMGFGSDRHGRRIPWIIGGMVVVVVSGVGAAAATALMASRPVLGMGVAVLAFFLLGVGVAASSTPFLAYLSERVDADRLAGAAAVTWIMMIMGIIITAGVVGSVLDPYSHRRLVVVTAAVGTVAMLLVLVAVAGRSDSVLVGPGFDGSHESPGEAGFKEAFAAMWSERESRRFATFIFVSMLAYSAQDIILEPFAGVVFGMTPGESTRIAGLQHGGVLLGMTGGAVVAARIWSLRIWSAIGCAASAVALVVLIVSAHLGGAGLMKASVFGLGLSNGIFAVAAIGAMMGLTVRGSGGAGLRMGFWGASQALAYGMGGFLGAAASDLARTFLGSPSAGYGLVFGMEALLFVVAAGLVLGTARDPAVSGAPALAQAGKAMVAAS